MRKKWQFVNNECNVQWRESSAASRCRELFFSRGEERGTRRTIASDCRTLHAIVPNHAPCNDSNIRDIHFVYTLRKERKKITNEIRESSRHEAEIDYPPSKSIIIVIPK